MNDPNNPLSEAELLRRQAIIDEFWEYKRWWEEFHRKNAERKSFHRGPSDSDWEYVK
jgi:hypothetical protein